MPWVACYFADGGYHKFYVVACPDEDELIVMENNVGAERCECVDDDHYSSWGD